MTRYRPVSGANLDLFASKLAVSFAHSKALDDWPWWAEVRKGQERQGSQFPDETDAKPGRT